MTNCLLSQYAVCLLRPSVCRAVLWHLRMQSPSVAYEGNAEMEVRLQAIKKEILGEDDEDDEEEDEDEGEEGDDEDDESDEEGTGQAPGAAATQRIQVCCWDIFSALAKTPSRF